MKSILSFTLIMLMFFTLTALTDLEIINNQYSDEQIKEEIKTNPDFLSKNIQEGNTILHFALDSKRFELVRFLIDKGADINRKATGNITPLMYPCLYGDKALFDYFISKGALIGDTLATENPILNFAVLGGNVEIADLLIKKGFNVNSFSVSGWTPLCRAVWAQKPEMVEFLLNHGADINLKITSFYQSSALFLAVVKKNYQITEILLNHNPDMNITTYYGINPFSEALNSNDVTLVQLFLDHGALTKSVSQDHDNIPILQAVFLNSEIFKMLIRYGADINQKNSAGSNALIYSIYSDSLTCFNYLIDAGADIHVTDGDGHSLLALAVINGRQSTVERLIQLNTDINLVDRQGLSPLHYSAIRGYEKIAQLLLNNNADLNFKDIRGKTPYQYAIQYKNSKVADLIKNKQKKQKSIKCNYAENFLKKQKKDELLIYHTGNNGWLIKTPKHYLIFDYFPQRPLSDDPCLDNGVITPEFLKDKDVIVFVSHEHSDHLDRDITAWQTVNPNIKYYFGSNPNNDQFFKLNPFPLPQFTTLAPDSTYKFDDLTVSTFKSPIDNGSGFLVQIDGFSIMHPGDAVYMNNDWPNAYSNAIDKVSKLTNHVDLAFFPVTGCGFNNPDALIKSNEYLMNAFNPNYAFPAHGTGSENLYQDFKDKYQSRFKKDHILYPLNKGDHFKLKL